MSSDNEGNNFHHEMEEVEDENRPTSQPNESETDEKDYCMQPNEPDEYKMPIVNDRRPIAIVSPLPIILQEPSSPASPDISDHENPRNGTRFQPRIIDHNYVDDEASNRYFRAIRHPPSDDSYENMDQVNHGAGTSRSNFEYIRPRRAIEMFEHISDTSSNAELDHDAVVPFIRRMARYRGSNVRRSSIGSRTRSRRRPMERSRRATNRYDERQESSSPILQLIRSHSNPQSYAGSGTRSQMPLTDYSDIEDEFYNHNSSMSRHPSQENMDQVNFGASTSRINEYNRAPRAIENFEQYSDISSSPELDQDAMVAFHPSMAHYRGLNVPRSSIANGTQSHIQVMDHGDIDDGVFNHNSHMIRHISMDDLQDNVDQVNYGASTSRSNYEYHRAPQAIEIFQRYPDTSPSPELDQIAMGPYHPNMHRYQGLNAPPSSVGNEIELEMERIHYGNMDDQSSNHISYMSQRPPLNGLYQEPNQINHAGTIFQRCNEHIYAPRIIAVSPDSSPEPVRNVMGPFHPDMPHYRASNDPRLSNGNRTYIHLQPMNELHIRTDWSDEHQESNHANHNPHMSQILPRNDLYRNHNQINYGASTSRGNNEFIYAPRLIEVCPATPSPEPVEDVMGSFHSTMPHHPGCNDHRALNGNPTYFHVQPMNELYIRTDWSDESQESNHANYNPHVSRHPLWSDADLNMNRMNIEANSSQGNDTLQIVENRPNTRDLPPNGIPVHVDINDNEFIMTSFDTSENTAVMRYLLNDTQNETDQNGERENNGHRMNENEIIAPNQPEEEVEVEVFDVPDNNELFRRVREMYPPELRDLAIAAIPLLNIVRSSRQVNRLPKRVIKKNPADSNGSR